MGVVHPADFKFELFFNKPRDVIAYQAWLAGLAVLCLRFELADLGVVFAELLCHGWILPALSIKASRFA